MNIFSKFREFPAGFLKGYRTLFVAFAFQLQALLEPFFISGSEISWRQFWLATLFAALRLITSTKPGNKE